MYISIKNSIKLDHQNIVYLCIYKGNWKQDWLLQKLVITVHPMIMCMLYSPLTVLVSFCLLCHVYSETHPILLPSLLQTFQKNNRLLLATSNSCVDDVHLSVNSCLNSKHTACCIHFTNMNLLTWIIRWSHV